MKSDESGSWGLSDRGEAPARFPTGDVVIGPAPFSEGLFREVDRCLADGRCPEGRLELESAETRLTCLIHESAPFLAGLQERSAYSQVPLVELASRARQLQEPTCTLIRTDNSCVLMVGVHFCKRPYLQGSTRLVNPAHVLRVLAREKQDAAMAFERAGTRTLLFLRQGQPARLLFGDPSDDPREGSLADRILLYAFADSAPPCSVEVFTNLKLAGDPDRGIPLAELADATRPCPPVIVTVGMADGREVRKRPFVPPEMIIGRDPSCNLFIDNLAVSRRHARLIWERGHFVVEDLESANGTSVNGERSSREIVTPADRIEIGKFRITMVELPTAPSAPETVFMARPASARPAAAPRFYLTGDGVSLKLSGDVLLGRGEGVDVQVRGFFVNPVHARISLGKAGAIEISGFGSGKVKVNGRKVGRARLEIGDQIAVGRSRFSIVSGPEPPDLNQPTKMIHKGDA